MDKFQCFLFFRFLYDGDAATAIATDLYLYYTNVMLSRLIIVCFSVYIASRYIIIGSVHLVHIICTNVQNIKIQLELNGRSKEQKGKKRVKAEEMICC